MALRIRVPALLGSSGPTDVTVGGQTLTVTPTLIVGAVNISVTINGQTITVTPVLVDGAVVITNPDVTVAGQTLTVTPVLIAGQVVGADSDDGGHWHYLLKQKKKRAQKRALATPKTWSAATALSDAVGRASFVVLPAASVSCHCKAEDAESQAAFSVADFSFAGVALGDDATASASFRVVNPIEDLYNRMRDLEDMVDLYALLVDA